MWCACDLFADRWMSRERRLPRLNHVDERRTVHLYLLRVRRERMQCKNNYRAITLFRRSRPAAGTRGECAVRKKLGASHVLQSVCRKSDADVPSIGFGPGAVRPETGTAKPAFPSEPA